MPKSISFFVNQPKKNCTSKGFSVSHSWLLKSATVFSLASVVFLSGCAVQPSVNKSENSQLSPTQSQQMDMSLVDSVQSIQQVTNNLRAAHSVAWHGKYQGFPMPQDSHSGTTGEWRTTSNDQPPVPPAANPDQPVSGPLGKTMYVQWSGPVNALGKALAEKLGWTYTDQSGTGDIMDVSVYGKHLTVLSVLKKMAAQLPNSVILKVEPGQIILEGAQ